MKLAWLTDIHLNFVEDRERRWFYKAIRDSGADRVIISGDVGEAPSVGWYLEEMVDYLKRPLYFVLGNHDFYDGSIAAVRNDMTELASQVRHLTYLTTSEPISLSKTTALIGHDGWADGRRGDYSGSGVSLNDFYYIREFRGGSSSQGPIPKSRPELLKVMQQLAEEAAESLAASLERALDNHTRVIALTHVPPFEKMCRYRGKPSGKDILPFYASQVMGERITQVMAAHPDKKLTLLCGHTHGSCRSRIAPNLMAYAGGASYGIPEIQRLVRV